MFSDIRPHTFGPIVIEQPFSAGVAASGLTPSVLAPPAVDPEEVEASAWAEGFEAGYASGVQSARQEREVATLELIALTGNAVENADDFMRSLERQVVDLAMAVAGKVVERELRSDPAVVLDVIHAALDEVRTVTSASLRVHPEDHALVSENWDRVVRPPLADRAHLVPDERVERGGCLIETQIGITDAQLSSKLSEIANGFEGLLEGEPL